MFFQNVTHYHLASATLLIGTLAFYRPGILTSLHQIALVSPTTAQNGFGKCSIRGICSICNDCSLKVDLKQSLQQQHQQQDFDCGTCAAAAN